MDSAAKPVVLASLVACNRVRSDDADAAALRVQPDARTIASQIVSNAIVFDCGRLVGGCFRENTPAAAGRSIPVRIGVNVVVANCNGTINSIDATTTIELGTISLNNSSASGAGLRLTHSAAVLPNFKTVRSPATLPDLVAECSRVVRVARR